MDAAAIDAESRHLLFQLDGVSAALTFVVASYRLASVRLAIMVLASAVYSTGLTLAVLYAAGGHMNLLMTMLPPGYYAIIFPGVAYARLGWKEITPPFSLGGDIQYVIE